MPAFVAYVPSKLPKFSLFSIGISANDKLSFSLIELVAGSRNRFIPTKYVNVHEGVI